MSSFFKHPWRATTRLLWLGVELFVSACDYGLKCRGRSAARAGAARGAWLQRSARRLLKVFHVDLQTSGRIPTHGLLVCNHLSYLDILVLGALSPAVFVAKKDVRKWPVLGWFGALAGTVFVDRNKRSQALESADAIEALLAHNALVILFPEGTSSGGDTVLPFKSSLLEPASRGMRTITAGHIFYHLEDGNMSEEVCYWKDMTLVPHLINLLTKRSIQASIRFAEVHESSTDRKQLARQLHSEVLKLKEAWPMPWANRESQTPLRSESPVSLCNSVHSS